MVYILWRPSLRMVVMFRGACILNLWSCSYELCLCFTLWLCFKFYSLIDLIFQGNHLLFLELFQYAAAAAAAAAKSLQSCLTLCNPKDGSPPRSPVPGILQARTLEGVAISFSNAWKWKVKGKSFSRVRLLATPWTAAHQIPQSMGFSRQEYWSGLPLPSLPFSV